MVNRTVELFWETQHLVGGLLDDTEYLCETVEIEFGPDGVIRKELNSLESQISALENVADPDVREYRDLHDLRAYFNLKRDMAKLKENKDVSEHLRQKRIWLDNPYIRHYIFKEHRLERMKKRGMKLLKRYGTEYPAEKDLESVIGQLDSRLTKLKGGNDVVLSLAEALKTYSDRRSTATKLAHGLLYAAMSYLQVAMTYADINFDRKLLAQDEKAVRKFGSLEGRQARLIDWLAKFEKLGSEVVKIGYREAMFDYRNHYSIALYETDDVLDERPSNIELFIGAAADDSCGGDDDEGEEPGDINPGSPGRFS